MIDPDPLPTIPLSRPPTVAHTAGHDDPSPDTTAPPPGRGADVGALIAGKYRLVEKLGEGGMGAVWRADQTAPVRRPVAVKLIRDGMGSAAAVARFEAERQALALMDHPHVAKVFDAGTTAGGDPFFVMEVVPGAPLTRFCDEARLPLRQRLELFTRVCLAVHHAHQRGIIHRDLKPGNVLVEDWGGTPVPKVIDFGLAKALGGAALNNRPDRTGVGVVVGTPLYMAPEQAGGDPAGVDTRTDVYALGVILYELLTGTTPIERARMARMDAYAQLLAVQQEEPPRPSHRLSAAAPGPGRGAAPGHSRAEVRGELDWITMKALAKDRNRRYASAAALAEDVGRHLRDEPVEAGPPSAGYRARKFVKRNRVPVAAAGLVVLALVGGVIGTTVGLVRARAATEESRRRLGLVERGNDILVSAFRDLDPYAAEKGGPPLQAQLGDRLDQAADLLDAEAVGDPLATARLQFELGVAQLNLGHPARAERLFARVVETCRARLGPDDPLALAAQNGLARAYRGLGRAADAAALFEQAVALAEARLGPDHDDTLTYRSNLAGAYRDLGRPADAARLYEETLRLREARHGPDAPRTLTACNNLASAYLALGRAADAVPLLERVTATKEAELVPDHPNTLAARNNLAEAYLALGRPADAARLHERTLELFEATLGPGDPRTLAARNNLAGAYLALGRAADAARMHERTLKTCEARHGEAHPDSLRGRNNLAAAYRTLGRAADAAALFEQTLRLAESRLPRDHPLTLATRNNLAVAYRDLGRTADAARLQEETVKRLEAGRPHDHPDTLTARLVLAEIYETLGDHARAEPIYRAAADRDRERFGRADPRAAGWLAILGRNLLWQRKFAAAEPVLRECLAVREKRQPDDWTTFHTRSMLGGALLGRGDRSAAEPLLQTGYAGLKRLAEAIPRTSRPRLREAGERLAQLYEATGRSTEAAEVRAELPPETAPPPRPARP